MSTKTSIKRIALVAVSALGFGLLNTVPASATVASMSANTTSLTVVGGAADGSDYGVFEISTVGAAGTALALQATQSLRAQVTAAPLGGTAANLHLGWSLNNGAAADDTFDPITGASNSVIATASTPATAKSISDTDSIAYNAAVLRGGATASNTYTLRVGAVGTGVNDLGAFTITVDLITSGNSIQTVTLKYTAVTSNLDSGAVVTSSSTGLQRSASAIGTTTNSNVRVTLRDANSGLIRADANSAPALSIELKDAAATPAVLTVTGFASRDAARAVASATVAAGVVTYTSASHGLRVGDTVTVFGMLPATLNGSGVVTSAVDGNTFTVASATATGPSIQAGFAALSGETSLDGNYIVNGTLPAIAATAQGSGTFTARYGRGVGTATVSLGTGLTAVATEAAPDLTADGMSLFEAGTPWTLPISTKKATLSVFAGTNSTTPLTNYPVVFTPTWSGNVAAGDISPVSGTPVIVRTDASGVAEFAIENKNPINGATLTVAISGFDAAVTSQVINWALPVATTVSVSGGQKVKFGSSNVVSATVLDQFDNPVVGAVVQPSIAGANSTALAPLPTVTTDSKGSVSITVTDAKATATAATDTVRFTVVSNGATNTTALNYVTTVPIISKFTAFYDLNQNEANPSTVVPSTGIYNGGTTRLAVASGLNYSRVIDTTGNTAGDTLVKYRFVATDSTGAAVVGIPVTITASAGGHIVGTSGLAVTSLTVNSGSLGYVDFVGLATGTGAITFTVTSGATSASASMWVGNTAANDARFVTLTGPATGTANGDALAFTAKVTDRFGNAVSGVQLTLAATGVGVFGGGSTLQTFTTDATGTFTFTGTSLVAAGGAATYTVTAAAPLPAQFSAVAGVSGGNVIDDTVAAGKASASVTVTYAAGVSASTTASNAATAAANGATDAANAAADAAAEAIDAANAATDAANLAAEAADAATVAAEEARDAADAATAAVEELATQVATLMAALKAQITTLANTVAKIAKKVKA